MRVIDNIVSEMLKCLRNRWVGLLLVLAASAVVAVLSSPACRLSSTDEEIFLLVGKSVAEGGRLYSEVFDHKGPFFLWLYVVGWRLAGTWGYWIIFSCLWTVASAIYYLGVLRYRGSALFATACAIAATIFPLVPGYPETFASAIALLVIGCMLLTFSGKRMLWVDFLAGLCGAAVFFSKQTCCGFFLGIGLLFLLTRLYRDLFCYVAGGIIGLAVGFACMYLSGTFCGYVECNWLFNAKYAIPFGTWMFGRTFSFFTMHGPGVVFGIAVAAFAVWSNRTRDRFWAYVLAAGAWIACDWFAIIRGWSVSDHQVKAFMFSFVCLLPFVLSWTGRVANYWIGMFYAAVVAAPLVTNVHVARHVDETDAPRRALISKLKTLPDAPLVTWDNRCRFQLETGRSCLLAPYVQVVPLVVRDGIPEKLAERLKEKLRTVPFVLLEGYNPGSKWMRGVPRYRKDNITDEFYKEIVAVRDSRMVELSSPDPEYRLYVSKELGAEK